MKKPQLKNETKIISYDRENRKVSFYASRDFDEFGVIEAMLSKVLTVDQGYDFNEVLEYIRNYQAACEVLNCNKMAENRYFQGLRVCKKHAK